MELKDYIGLNYPITFVRRKDGQYIAWYPDFGHATIFAIEKTRSEALKVLNESKNATLEIWVEEGTEIPMPFDANPEDKEVIED